MHHFPERRTPQPRISTARARNAYAGALAAALMSFYAPARADEAYAAASTQPAQRYMSLKTDVANGREGPSRDHRILWIYQRQGLPLKVLQEWEGWRKVEDPFGDQTWLLSTMLERKRTVYVRGDNGQDATLRARPDMESRVRAEVARGVVGDLVSCSRGWCEVSIDGVKGWLPRRTLWGADAPLGR